MEAEGVEKYSQEVGKAGSLKVGKPERVHYNKTKSNSILQMNARDTKCKGEHA